MAGAVVLDVAEYDSGTQGLLGPDARGGWYGCSGQQGGGCQSCRGETAGGTRSRHDAPSIRCALT
jgi:hypothetical protein